MAGTGAPWQFGLEMVEQRCGYLLSSGQLSDCTFVVGSGSKQEVVLAHKLILAMASPIFEVMFYDEPSEPVLSIPDAKPEAFKALLRYIYTGNLKLDSFEMPWDLWHVAKKYKLPNLVKECSGYIGSVLCPSNVCRAYELAQVFDEGTLIDKCLKIISTNTNEVLNHSSFMDIEIKTLITVCSLDHLNVDSELDLFQAVARYAEVEEYRQTRTLSESLSALRLAPTASGEQESSLRVASSSGTSPAAKLLSTPAAEVDTSEPTADEENLKEEEPSIRAALQKLRFLSLSGAQFAEGPARSALLTQEEKLAVFMNIASGDSPMPMPTGFSECREQRQSRRDEDDEGPSVKPRMMLRTDFGTVVSYASMNNADQIVQGLSTGDLETCEAAARAARRLLTRDTERSSQAAARLVAAGGIPALVAALGRSGPSVQFDATCALTNIACVDTYALTIVQAGGVPTLVGLLKRGGVLAAQAAWALGNLAGQRPACDAVVEAGALPALLALLQPDAPPEQLGTYARAFRIICQSCRLSGVPLDSGPAVARFKDLIASNDDQVLTESSWVLYHLMDEESFVGLSSVPPEECGRLAGTLCRAGAAPRRAAAALAALANMLRITELTKPCLEAGCLGYIIDSLKSENPSTVKYAAWAAANILGNSLNGTQQALQMRMLDPLGELLTHGDHECKGIAARALTHLCAKGGHAQLGVLAAAAALQPYCRLLADSATRFEALRGLTNLLQNYNTLALWLKLRELGVPQLLEAVREDPWYQEDADKLLTKYFSGNDFKVPGSIFGI